MAGKTGAPVLDKRMQVRRRSRARRLTMQALYQWQLNPQSFTTLMKQYKASNEYPDADAAYFKEVLQSALKSADVNMAAISQFADRPLEQLDPLEKAIMMVALTELRDRLDVPVKVVINEAIELARRFGATDGHKYVNAILDRAARELRVHEHRK